VNLVPVLHRLIVEPEAIETKTASGIILTVNEKAERKAVERGKVLAIGDTAFKDFKAGVIPVIGDTIYFAKYAGKEVTEDGKDYLILNDEDVICIIKKEG
jgi:chaperonin GroES